MKEILNILVNVISGYISTVLTQKSAVFDPLLPQIQQIPRMRALQWDGLAQSTLVMIVLSTNRVKKSKVMTKAYLEVQDQILLAGMSSFCILYLHFQVSPVVFCIVPDLHSFRSEVRNVLAEANVKYMCNHRAAGYSFKS